MWKSPNSVSEKELRRTMNENIKVIMDMTHQQVVKEGMMHLGP